MKGSFNAPFFYAEHTLLLFTIDTLDFENHRSCSVITTGYHNFIVVHPTVHNASTLKCRVNLTTYSVPRFRTKRNALCSAMSRSGRL